MTTRPTCTARQGLPRAALAGLVLLGLVPPVAACTFGGPPPTAEDRETRRDCNAEADRIFAVRNRYQISERDQSDSPYAGNTLPSNPTSGLSDQYEQDRLIDSCLAHGGAGGSPAASAAAPAGGPATQNPGAAAH